MKKGRCENNVLDAEVGGGKGKELGEETKFTKERFSNCRTFSFPITYKFTLASVPFYSISDFNKAFCFEQSWIVFLTYLQLIF